MHVLIADPLSATTVHSLKALGVSVDLRPDLSADELPSRVGEADVLVVRSTKVKPAAIEAGRSLSLIVRAGAGVNTIDVAAASERGIYVANCPGKNAAAVAELTIGLLIACDRRIVDAASELREGHWLKKKYGEASGLRGRTLGIIGLGTIGRAVAEAARGLGMKIVAWSRSLTPELAAVYEVERAESPIELARRADAITIHTAYTPELKHFVDAKFLESMRDGAILINTARGDLVDSAALAEAIRTKGLRVGLDVYDNEPSGWEGEFPDTKLARMVTGTPHIGASTEQAAEAIAAEAVRIVRVFRETGKPPAENTVNLCGRSPATHSLVVRHFNRVGVLAGVLDALREEGINVEEMDNTIFDGAHAACCTLQLDTAPSTRVVASIRENPAVLQVTVQAR
ncbi:MAG: NAD(P)-dependent oxidoreductase [Planctomycetaceae bacterium]